MKPTLLLGCLLLACNASGPTSPERPRAPQKHQRQASLAVVGLEADSMDRSADPCDDFVRFACGGWQTRNPIPEDKPIWGRFSELQLRNEAVLTALLDAASHYQGPDVATQQVGNFYASCLATPKPLAQSELAPVFGTLARLPDLATWRAALVTLHRLGIFVGFEISVDPDLRDSTKYAVSLDTGRLGLPNRDYYLEPSFAPKRSAYQAHAEQVFALLGAKPAIAKREAAELLALETALAKVTKTAVQRRDVPGMYNPMPSSEVASAVTSVDWAAYWQAQGIPAPSTVVVTTPGLLKAFDGLRTQAGWPAYLRYHLASATRLALGGALDDEMFALSQTISGVAKPRTRPERCVDATGAALEDAVGQLYIAQQFAGDARAQADQLVTSIMEVMRDEMGQLAWMTPATRQAAQIKLGKLAKMIGYPDQWRRYDLTIQRDAFFTNWQAATRAELTRKLARAGQAVDRNEWLMPAFIVNAYYNPSANNTALPAGILQPPFFGATRSPAANLGGIGMVIGHELTHAFDDQGAQFDGEGNLRNWWAAADAGAFKARGTCVAEAYSKFEPAPGKAINGQLTLGENIADLGGVKMAYAALQRIRATQDTEVIAEGLTEPQQFFVAMAQAWCTNVRPAELERRLATDPHSPASFRITGALQNLPAFAEAFACKPGTRMAPVQRCEIW